MGDRFDRLGVRHVNVEALLRRPGIGHNNGPTFDMSWEAWVWRRAAAKAWKTPKPEVAMMRLKRAERLGITYKELTSALMDSGSHLGAAVLPLSLAARVRRGPLNSYGQREVIAPASERIGGVAPASFGEQGVCGCGFGMSRLGRHQEILTGYSIGRDGTASPASAGICSHRSHGPSTSESGMNASSVIVHWAREASASAVLRAGKPKNAR